MSKLDESCFVHGEIIRFISILEKREFLGMVDFSYGDERSGYIRVSEMDESGDMIYVPIEQIIKEEQDD